MNADDIKKFCKDNGLTYKELAELIGMTEGSFKVAITTKKISNQTIRAIELFAENLQLKKELADFKTLKEILSR